MSDREKKIVMKKNFRVDIFPYFEKVFSESKHVSCIEFLLTWTIDQKGKLFYAVRPPSKRNKDADIGADIIASSNSIEDQNLILEA